MGNGNSTPVDLQGCLDDVCGGRPNCVGYPDSDPLFPFTWARPYNLDHPVTPTAVVRPTDAEEVSRFVMCAVDNSVKVQARSGGHSYANFGLGGQDGELVIDLVNLQEFSMDKKTWQATIGGGHKLADVSQKLHDHGGRAIAHGTCPGVGIGGHATIGGLGPMSRMWGSCLDHVMEVEVVVANGTILRANERHNSDLFFALKGAGAGFGIVTEFVMKTHTEPGNVVQHSFTHTFGDITEMADIFSQWQALISDPDLDRRFGSEFVLHELGVVVTATFYGTEAEFDATGIPDKLPAASGSIRAMDWLGALHQEAQDAALWLSDVSAPFTAKSLAFRQEDLLPEEGIRELFRYVDGARRGTLLWFLIFDVTGGAINDVPVAATAYRHRDKIMFAQGYGIGVPAVSPDTRDFLSGIVDTIRRVSPGGSQLSTYPGYVDASLRDAQQSYWGPNLPALEHVKAAWDPTDVFHNPQSVRPAAPPSA